MTETSGVGGSPIQPEKFPGAQEATGGPTGGSLEAALHTPVRTLGQLKQMLISNLGEKEGTKMYNTFMKSFAMQILNQMQQSAAQAKKAAQQMRQGPQG